MRLIAFAFLCVFALAGIMRHSRAAAPETVAASALQSGSFARAFLDESPANSRLSVLGTAAPAPQVLRHKRRFARAALRATQQAQAPQKAAPLKQAAKAGKLARR